MGAQLEVQVWTGHVWPEPLGRHPLGRPWAVPGGGREEEGLAESQRVRGATDQQGGLLNCVCPRQGEHSMCTNMQQRKAEKQRRGWCGLGALTEQGSSPAPTTGYRQGATLQQGAWWSGRLSGGQPQFPHLPNGQEGTLDIS